MIFPKHTEISTTKHCSSSHVHSKPKIHLSQQHASLPGASWKGVVPYILSAFSSPGASWKVTVPLIISAGYNTNNRNATGHNQHVQHIYINHPDTNNCVKVYEHIGVWSPSPIFSRTLEYNPSLLPNKYTYIMHLNISSHKMFN